MSEYDNTNSGVVFPPFEDQELRGQGTINIDGTDFRVVLCRQSLSKDGDPVNVLYARLGVLFANDSDNEKAPDMSGPCDLFPAKKIAGWIGEKDNRKYISIRMSDKQGGDSSSGALPDRPGSSVDNDRAGSVMDDEIPF